MATLVGSQVKLDNGQVITPQQGGWYDSQQFWGGTLSAPGVINSLSNQPGAGKEVSPEILRQTSVAAGLAPTANEEYINSLKGITATTTGGAGTAGTGTTSPELTDLNNKIAEAEASINFKKTEADKRRAEVNDNPFLSESSRVGRIAKIDSLLNDSLQSDQANLTNLQSQLTSRQAELKANTQIETVTDDNGNMTIVTIDKNTGKIINQTSAGSIGKATKSTGTETNNYRNIILDAAITTDSSFITVDGKLKPVTGEVDEAGNPLPKVGDKQLSRQEYEHALDMAYANSGTKGGFTGSREEFAKIFDQVLADNGYSSWGD